MNKMRLEFCAKSDNESFARIVASAFLVELDPTLEELSEIKTAVSEAVTNAVIHGYNGNENGIISLEGKIEDNNVTFVISDNGSGISDIEMARQPMYTGKPSEERSGMGFTIMESFMDSVEVKSNLGIGTTVVMSKCIGVQPNEK